MDCSYDADAADVSGVNDIADCMSLVLDQPDLKSAILALDRDRYDTFSTN